MFVYSAPSLTRSLFGVLLRFRAHNVAVSAEIEKLVLQINLQPDDRQLVRF